jgi:RNA polymerase sigma factor (sigma-70 family)
MTLLSLSASSFAPRSARSASAGGAYSPSPPARMTLDEELRLAGRLRALRRDLLALALLDPACKAELSRVAAEVADGALRIEAAVDEPESTADEARRHFDAFRAAAERLPAELGAPLTGAAAASDAAAATGMPPEAAFERALQASLDVAGSIDLQWHCVERLLRHSWSSGPGSRASGAPCWPLPPALAQRALRSQTEIGAIFERFVSSNQGLVANVVRRYRGLGLRQEDLMQDGNIGLLRAVEKFDPRRARPFRSYAVWWVRESVRRALAQQARTIRLPVSAIATRYTIGKASRQLAHELGRDPSSLELARATGMTPESIDDAMGSCREPLSLDAPRADDTELTLGDVIADRLAHSPNEQTSARESVDRLQALLAGLTLRERNVLSLRFGLDGGDERTLEEIGRSLHLTRERVRQIVAAALDKLHRATRAQGLDL